MLVFEERAKPEYPEKNLSRSEQGENQQQTQPTYDAGAGNRTRATLVGGECSHHYTTPAPRKLKLYARKLVRVWYLSLLGLRQCYTGNCFIQIAYNSYTVLRQVSRNIPQCNIPCNEHCKTSYRNRCK